MCYAMIETGFCQKMHISEIPMRKNPRAWGFLRICSGCPVRGEEQAF